jgi:catechol 2,3-dioxygenase-like lactoylglutathione lyase family enzyme
VRITRLSLVAAAVVAALVLASRPEGLRAQATELATAKVNHIGIATPDIEKTIKEYQRVMGFGPVKATTIPLPLPDGRKAEIKLATFYMPNFHIELTQPVSQYGPYHDHLRAHGLSIMHVGTIVEGPNGSVDAMRQALEAKGGTWTLGEKGSFYAFVNLANSIGTTIEVGKQNPQKGMAPAVPPGDALPPLGALPATHVGWAAADAAAASAAMAGIFGAAAPKIMDYKDSQYPPNHAWNMAASLRIGFHMHQGTGLEFIESVGGPTPWSEFVARHKGTSPQHLAINVGARMDEQIADLQKKGGKWTNGKAGGGYAYLDFMDTLGLIFELNGSSRSAAPAAK